MLAAFFDILSGSSLTRSMGKTFRLYKIREEDLNSVAPWTEAPRLKRSRRRKGEKENYATQQQIHAMIQRCTNRWTNGNF